MEKSDTIVIAMRVSEDTPLLSTLSRVAEAAHRLQFQGHRVIICTTGIVNIGRLDRRRSEKCLDAISIDALAALGQGKLTAMWNQLFGHLRQSTAQITISKDDIRSTTRLKKIQQVVKDLLMHEAIPIVGALGRILPAMNQSSEASYLGGIVAAITGSAYIVVVKDKLADLHQTKLRACLDLSLMAMTALDIGTGHFAAVYLECNSSDASRSIDHGSKLIVEDIEAFSHLPATIEKVRARRVKTEIVLSETDHRCKASTGRSSAMS